LAFIDGGLVNMTEKEAELKKLEMIKADALSALAEVS